jgi:hypothetical protein
MRDVGWNVIELSRPDGIISACDGKDSFPSQAETNLLVWMRIHGKACPYCPSGAKDRHLFTVSQELGRDVLMSAEMPFFNLFQLMMYSICPFASN